MRIGDRPADAGVDRAGELGTGIDVGAGTVARLKLADRPDDGPRLAIYLL
jgi:hypothetical protein